MRISYRLMELGVFLTMLKNSMGCAQYFIAHMVRTSNMFTLFIYKETVVIKCAREGAATLESKEMVNDLSEEVMMFLLLFLTAGIGVSCGGKVTHWFQGKEDEGLNNGSRPEAGKW